MRIDEAREKPVVGDACSQYPRDHEAHIGRLVDDVRLISATRCVRVAEWEDRRSDHIAGACPGLQHARIDVRRAVESVAEHDQRKRPRRSRRRTRETIHPGRVADRWVENHCHQGARLWPAPREMHKSPRVDEADDNLPDRERPLRAVTHALRSAGRCRQWRLTCRRTAIADKRDRARDQHRQGDNANEVKRRVDHDSEADGTT